MHTRIRRQGERSRSDVEDQECVATLHDCLTARIAQTRCKFACRALELRRRDATAEHRQHDGCDEGHDRQHDQQLEQRDAGCGAGAAAVRAMEVRPAPSLVLAPCAAFTAAGSHAVHHSLQTSRRRCTIAVAKAWASLNDEEAIVGRKPLRSASSRGASAARPAAIRTYSSSSRAIRDCSPAAPSIAADCLEIMLSSSRATTGTPIHSASHVVAPPLYGNESSAMSTSAYSVNSCT